jgi:hypothetical protein
LISKRQKFFRKKFGRFLFTNFFVNFFQNKNINKVSEELFYKEFKIIENYLPKKIFNLMDVGCGLGIVNIFINNKYNNKINFFLLDKDKIDSKIRYGFSENYESYNSLRETKKILIDNRINKENIHLFDVEKSIQINNKIDLVISLKSMSYHYPFENYLKLFKKCCTKETIFIFDVTDGYFKKNSLINYFEDIQIIYHEESVHSLKRVCCKGLKNNYL